MNATPPPQITFLNFTFLRARARPHARFSIYLNLSLKLPPSLPTSSAHPTTQLSSPSCEIFLSLYAARQSSDPPILQVLLIPRNLGLRSSVCLSRVAASHLGDGEGKLCNSGGRASGYLK